MDGALASAAVVAPSASANTLAAGGYPAPVTGRAAKGSRGASSGQLRRRRRTALLIALAVLIALGYLAGKHLLATDTQGASVDEISIESAAAGRELDVDVAVPANASRDDSRPLLVFLHGRGGSAHSFSDNEAMFEALAELGDAAPVVAFPDGGGDGYWHDRTGAAWGSYVVGEVIPTVARRFPVDPERVAIGGISMGGFGAYDIALLHPGRFCAVGGHSPALWRYGGETAVGAFDDAEDFDRHDVIAGAAKPGAFGGIPVWNDAGRSDPFLPGDAAFAAALEVSGADLTARRWPGGHEGGYWDRHWDEYLRFYARALRGCG